MLISFSTCHNKKTACDGGVAWRGVYGSKKKKRKTAPANVYSLLEIERDQHFSFNLCFLSEVYVYNVHSRIQQWSDLLHLTRIQIV